MALPSLLIVSAITAHIGDGLTVEQQDTDHLITPMTFIGYVLLPLNG